MVASKATARGLVEAKRLICSAVSMIEIASSALEVRLKDQARKRLDLAEAERNLKDHRNSVIAANSADPKALGANEAAREAAIAQQTSGSITAVDIARRELLDADTAVEIARLRVSSANAKMDEAQGLLKVGELRTLVGIANTAAGSAYAIPHA